MKCQDTWQISSCATALEKEAARPCIMLMQYVRAEIRNKLRNLRVDTSQRAKFSAEQRLVETKLYKVQPVICLAAFRLVTYARRDYQYLVPAQLQFF
jgi:hypothetical protein